MAAFWTRMLQALRGKKATHRSRSVQRRFLKLELLEGRKLMANDLATISGTVFTDSTENGLDGGDARISGATITLYRDGGNTTFDNGGGDDVTVGSTTSNGSGNYSFTGLTAGTYYVRQSTVSGQLQRSTVTTQTVVIDSTDVMGTLAQTIDDFNSGTQVVTATVAGVTPVSDATDVAGILGGERDIFADATGGTAGNTVSLRVDNAGVSNLLEFQSDAGTTGTRIVTWDGNDNDAATLDATTGLGAIDLTTGSATGFSLAIGTDIASNVVIRVYSSSGNSSVATLAMPVTTGGAAPTSANLTVAFSSFTTLGGTGADFTSVRAIQLEFDGAAAADGQVDIFGTAAPTVETVNFANLNPMTIGDLIWEDRDNDGSKDTAETGINNVTVQLYVDDGDGSYDSGDTLSTSTTTNSTGAYSFGNLLPGDYIVVVPSSQFSTGQALAGYVTSTPTATDPDDNTNGDDNGAVITGLGVGTLAITLVAGSEPTNDGDTDANTNMTVDLGFAPQTDLTVDKSTSATNAPAGGTVTYSITASNSGPLNATNVTVTDTLPLGATVISATGGTGTPVVTPQSGSTPGTVVYTVGSLASGATSSAMALVLSIPPSATGTFVNDVAVAGTELETNTSNNTDSVNLNVSRVAGVTISKSDSPDPVVAGQNVTYTLTVRNDGPSTATNVVVSDPVPTGLTFVSANSTQGTATLVPASGSTPATVQVNVGTMNVDAPSADTDVTITVVLSVPTGFTGSLISNTATVDSDESSPANDSEDTTVTKNIDLAITKSANLSTAVAGSNLTYTLSVTNNGPSTASNVQVIDDLPAGLTVVSVTPSIGTHNTSSSAGDVVVDITSMTSGQTGTITIVVGVPSNQTASLVNSATIGLTSSTGFTETDSNNNSASVTTPLTNSVDLVVAKTDTPDPVVAGQTITYTVTVTNDGPSDAAGVSLSDNIPDGLRITSVTGTVGSTAISSGSITIPASAQDTTAANTDDITVAIGSLVDNAIATITVIGVVLPSTRGSLSNVATATTSSNESDNTDNSATATSTVNATSGLTITKTDSPDPVVAGQTVTYTIDVTNSGPSDATTVVLTDNLPDGIKITSVTGTVGSTAIASSAITIPTTAQDDTAANNDDISINVGTLIPNVSSTSTPTTGSRATIQVVATVLGTTRGTLNNSASVVSAESTTPTTATAATTVNPSIDLAITKTDSADPATNGSTLTYTITVTNTGPSAATNVRVTDILPSQLTFVSASASQGTASHASGTVTGTLGTIASGGTVTMTINATVNVTSPTTVTNVATVTADESESNVSNNTATQTTQLGQLRTITGKAFLDDDASRTLNTGDDGISSVTITLFMVNGSTRTQVSQTTTDSSGNFSFTNLAEGTYDIVQTTTGVTFDGLSLLDGTEDLPGTFGTKTANNNIRVNLMNGNSSDNNFIWYRQSLSHVCFPSKFRPATA